MSAGPELDALVAQKVMGWTFVGCERTMFHTEFVPHGIPSAGARRKMVPAYSTDIAAAWEVVERMQQRAVNAGADEWSPPDSIWSLPAAMAAAAISRAALAAVGAEVPA